METHAHTPGVAPQWSLPSTRQVVRDVSANVTLVLLAGVLTGLAFPPYEYWPLAFCCLIPLLIALRRTVAVRAAAWLMLLYGLVVCAVALHWMQSIFGAGAIGVYIIASLPWLLFALAYRVTAPRVSLPALCLLAPMLWVAVEWVRCEGWYFAFSWLQLGFTLVSWGGNAALYPLFGVYGVTFLLVLINVAGAGMLQQQGPMRGKLVHLLLLFFLIFLPLDAVYWHVINAGLPTPARRALVVQDESSDLATLRSLTLPAAQGVDLIVWPEYAVMDYPLSQAALLRQLQAVARETGSVLVLGAKEEAPKTARVDGMRRRGMLLAEGKLFYNTALVLAPDGRVLGTYRKTHPIQFFSDGVPGGAYPTIASPLGRLGVAICYDFDFATTARTLVQHGAEVLVVPTYDAADWTEVQHAQHARIAQARAAEVGRWVVRATTSGESQVISPLGHLHAQLAGGQSRIVKGPFAPRGALTPYVRWTYRLPLVCLGLGLAWLLWLAGATIRIQRQDSRASADSAA